MGAEESICYGSRELRVGVGSAVVGHQAAGYGAAPSRVILRQHRERFDLHERVGAGQPGDPQHGDRGRVGPHTAGPLVAGGDVPAHRR